MQERHWARLGLANERQEHQLRSLYVEGGSAMQTSHCHPAGERAQRCVLRCEPLQSQPLAADRAPVYPLVPLPTLRTCRSPWHCQPDAGAWCAPKRRLIPLGSFLTAVSAECRRCRASQAPKRGSRFSRREL